VRISAKCFSRHCASALSCIAFASSLMAFQQQQWTVEYAGSPGRRVVEVYMWNAGRMNNRDQLINTNGSIQRDQTFSFALREVAFDDPQDIYSSASDGGKLLYWEVVAHCREGSENGGNCITLTNNLDRRNGSAVTDHDAILFKTQGDAVAFLRFFKN
jgi:hypothetical protein